MALRCNPGAPSPHWNSELRGLSALGSLANREVHGAFILSSYHLKCIHCSYFFSRKLLYGLEVAMGALDTSKNSIIPMENKQNIIPARATLMKRRLIGDPSCHFCKVMVKKKVPSLF